MESTAVRRKRLLHRSRYRGFLEIDLVFARFTERHLGGLDEPQLDRLEALLEESDQDIWGWVTGRAAAPARHDNDILALLRDAAEGRAG
jgi:antitoxin CptB